MTGVARTGIRGTLEVRVFRGGECVEHTAGENLVVASGRVAAAAALAGDPGKVVAYFGVGTNGAAPKDTDSALTDAVLVPLAGVTYPEPGKVRFAWVLGKTVPPMAIREFGLLTADGTLFARKTRAVPIDKTDDVTLESGWTVSFPAIGDAGPDPDDPTDPPVVSQPAGAGGDFNLYPVTP